MADIPISVGTYVQVHKPETDPTIMEQLVIEAEMNADAEADKHLNVKDPSDATSQEEKLSLLFKKRVYETNFYCEEDGPISQKAVDGLELLDAYFLKYGSLELLHSVLLHKAVKFLQKFIFNRWLWEDEEAGRSKRYKPCEEETKSIDKMKIFQVFSEICLRTELRLRHHILEYVYIHIWEKFMFDENYKFFSNLAFATLVNLSHSPTAAREMMNQSDAFITTVLDNLNKWTWDGTDKTAQKFEFAAMLLTNLTNICDARRYIIEYYQCLNFLTSLLKDKSALFRKHIAGTIKNCVFEIDLHITMLKTRKLLPAILMPLAPPGVCPPRDQSALTRELHYTKKTFRETDPSIQSLLLDALYKLCQTRKVREYLRDQNIYVILREYHKITENEELIEKTERIVNLLLQTEEEIGVDDLCEVGKNEVTEEKSDD